VKSGKFVKTYLAAVTNNRVRALAGALAGIDHLARAFN